MEPAFNSKEFWEVKYDDLSRAMAAMLRHMGMTYGQFENWQVYLAEGYGADAIEVDEDGHRVPRSPTWIDQFECEIDVMSDLDDHDSDDFDGYDKDYT